jgi:hypothetical protein
MACLALKLYNKDKLNLNSYKLSLVTKFIDFLLFKFHNLDFGLWVVLIQCVDINIVIFSHLEWSCLLLMVVIIISLVLNLSSGDTIFTESE